MSIDDLLTQDLATVARGVEAPPAPVAELVARGRRATRRNRLYAAGAVAASVALVVGGSVAIGLGDRGQERPAPSGRPTGLVGLGYPVGEPPQVPTEINRDTWVGGRLLPDAYEFHQVLGGGVVAADAVDTHWRVLTQQGPPMIPDTNVGFPAPGPDGDRVAWVDRADIVRPELVLWTFAGGEQSGEARLAMPRSSHPRALGIDALGNVYYDPGLDEQSTEAPPLRVWNPETGVDADLTWQGENAHSTIVVPQGLQFSDAAGSWWTGAPGTDGALREAARLPRVTWPILSPGGTRVTWVTDKTGEETTPESLPEGVLVFAMVQDVGAPDTRRRVDLPEDVEFEAVSWEDDEHLLLRIYDTSLGTKQSLLRCDLDGDCEYAVPPED